MSGVKGFAVKPNDLAKPKSPIFTLSKFIWTHLIYRWGCWTSLDLDGRFCFDDNRRFQTIFGRVFFSFWWVRWILEILYTGLNLDPNIKRLDREIFIWGHLSIYVDGFLLHDIRVVDLAQNSDLSDRGAVKTLNFDVHFWLFNRRVSPFLLFHPVHPPISSLTWVSLNLPISSQLVYFFSHGSLKSSFIIFSV